MRTTDDFLNLIKSDEELKSLIVNSKNIWKNYKPRFIRRFGMKTLKTRHSYALEHFWKSMDGIKFRVIIESKYKMELVSPILVGKLKTALAIFITEVIDECEKKT